MGSHAEKDYILKLSKQYDGIIIGANIVEATSGATASLVGQKLKVPYYIDPMTYVFGCDLDGIRSEQRRKKKTVIDYKRAYRKLASELGTLFINVLKRKTAVEISDFTSKILNEVCQKVVEYQLKRLRTEFEKDEEYKDYAESIPKPTAVFSPYFFIESGDWLDLFLDLSKTTADLKPEKPVYSVLCADYEMLIDHSFIERAITEIPETGISGVWLWFSNFDEWSVQEEYLNGLKNLVKQLSQKGLEVYNRHGGYFSLALNKFGMKGISHGVGYGEKKDVFQKSAPTTPVVQYYLPGIYKRFGVDAIERCLSDLGIKTPQDFYKYICNCVICKGVIKNNIYEFLSFGDTHYAKETSKKPTQTAAAAKKCRFHFLMNRIKESYFIGGNDIKAIVQKINNAQEKWKDQYPIITHSNHLSKWSAVLSS
jgi:hypothetical protein